MGTIENSLFFSIPGVRLVFIWCLFNRKQYDTNANKVIRCIDQTRINTNFMIQFKTNETCCFRFQVPFLAPNANGLNPSGF